MTVVHTQVSGFGEEDFGSLPFGAGIQAGNTALQFEAVIVDSGDANGLEFDSAPSDTPIANGLQFFATNLGFKCPGFGEFDFGTLPFGATACFASAGVQFEGVIEDFAAPQAIQFFVGVEEFPNPNGVQFEGLITQPDPNAVEFLGKILDFPGAQGVQFEGVIADFLNEQGIQFEGVIEDATNFQGLEFSSGIGSFNGIEFNAINYNTTQIRILCEFDSRGVTTGAGNNAWGNPIATGQNWKTNSQDPADDYTVQNLNTDIVEQTYRSAVRLWFKIPMVSVKDPGDSSMSTSRLTLAYRPSRKRSS